MKKTIIDLNALSEAVKKEVGDSFVGCTDKGQSMCYMKIKEDLEESAWVGKFTETIRGIVKSMFPSVKCVCVKPLPTYDCVWYSIDVA